MLYLKTKTCGSLESVREESWKLLFVKIMCIALALIVAGCVAFEEGYTTRYGLTNPDNPPIHPDLMDETQSSGTVGQQEIEGYEKKYREKNIFQTPEAESLKEEGQQSQ